MQVAQNELRFAVFGAGFWARFQLSAWREVTGARCVALCDPDRVRAEALAGSLGVDAVYTDPEEVFRRERLDFVDIVSAIESHAPLVLAAANHGVPAICQKPLASDLDTARSMARACRDAGVPLLVHENFRWQAPIREAARVLREGQLGRVFRARLDFNSGFPVFDNQPALKRLPQFILTDVGPHVLDVARFLFGEATSLACRTHKIHADIAGEDVATVMLDTRGGATVLCQMAYAGTPLERECFPQTLLFVEGDRGSLELGPDHWLRLTTATGTRTWRCPPTRFPWVDPAYAVVQASIVPCNANLLEGIRGGKAETTAEDNLKTLELVFAAYEAAASGQTVRLAG